MSESKRLVGFGVVPSEGPVRIVRDPSDTEDFLVERWTDSGWIKLSGPGVPTLADFAAGSSTLDRMRMEGISEEDLNSFK